MNKIKLFVLTLIVLVLQTCMLNSNEFNSGIGNLIRLLGLTEAVNTVGVGTGGDLIELSGYLKDENGSPISNATLNVVQNSSGSIRASATGSTITESDGRYSLRLKIGSFSVQVTSSSGVSLGNFLVIASSPSVNPIITMGSGNFIVTVSAFNSTATLAPSALSYSGSPFTFTKDNPIPTKIPTYSGSIASCRSVPTLPSGLSLSSACEITGTPTVVQIATAYHIIATNSYGSGSVVIVITVNQLAPSGFGYFNNVVSLTQNLPIANLGTYYTGTITSCSAAPPLPSGLSLDPSSCTVFGTPTSTQTSTNHTITASNSVGSTTTTLTLTVNLQPPSSLSYSGSPFVFTKGINIQNIVPAYTGTIHSCSSNPTFPNGLNLSSTCTISGSPNNLQSQSTYSITATNSVGSTSFNIQITIIDNIVSMPLGILKTGQITSYINGDDGDQRYRKGVSRNFLNGGTSGLIWQRCSGGQNNDATCSGNAQNLNWNDANSYCNNLTLDGRSWRLPSINELANLIDYGQSISPLINKLEFPNTIDIATYWSSYENSSSSTYSYMIDLFYGLVAPVDKLFNNGIFVKCVSGQPSSVSLLNDNGNNTILDSTSGLLWQKCSAGQSNSSCSGTPSPYNWANAISYCENLVLGNRNDWRLPNINELRSIIKFDSTTNPMVNTSYFPNTNSTKYWSSTTVSFINSNAYLINFNLNPSQVNLNNKSITNLVRCVAGPINNFILDSSTLDTNSIVLQ